MINHVSHDSHVSDEKVEPDADLTDAAYLVAGTEEWPYIPDRGIGIYTYYLYRIYDMKELDLSPPSLSSIHHHASRRPRPKRVLS